MVVYLWCVQAMVKYAPQLIHADSYEVLGTEGITNSNATLCCPDHLLCN